MTNSYQQQAIPPAKRIWLALLVAVTFFMENLDATVIATAIPDMARDFSVKPVALNIGISAYLLAVAIFIPSSSWLVNRLGARFVFSGAILIFTLSSVLCALSTSLWMFTLSRILQGVGGALMVPVGRMVVLGATEKKDMVKTIAFISWPGLIAPVLGPVAGGAIATYSSWQWIFWLNIPIGIIALAASLKLIPSNREASTPEFDIIGFIWISLSCLLSIAGLELLANLHFTFGFISLTLALFTGYFAVTHSKHKERPLLSLAPFKSQTFSKTVIGGSFFRASINAIPFLLPLLFQLGFGWSAIEAGMMVLWVFAGNIAIKPFTTFVMFRWGFRTVMLINGALSLIALLSCLLLTSGLSHVVCAALLFAGGMTRSLQFSCYNSLGFAEIKQANMKDASVLFSIFFQFSMSAGISLAALLIQMSMAWKGHGHTTSEDVHFAFIGMSGLILISIISVYKLKSDAGSAVLTK